MAEPGERQEVWSDSRFERRDRLARAPEEEAAQTRFWIGLGVFLAVALLYPWYAYWVQTRLFAHEVPQAMRDADAVFRQHDDAVGRAITGRAPASRRQEAATRHEAPVRTMGAVRMRSGPMVIVELGGRSLEDARPTICAHAARWLRMPMEGQVLRVQRYRADRPAISVGEVRC